MIINITNNSGYKNIYLCYDGITYNLSDNHIVDIETNKTNMARLLIDIRDKNNVYPNLIDLFFGIFNPENSICKIKCSYVCEIESTNERCSLIVNDLASDNDNGIIYESVFIDSENANIKTIDYKLSDIESTKKRHNFLQLFVLSSLPLTLLLIILCIINFSWSLISIILLDVLLLVFPAIRKIKRFNEVCTDVNARNILLNSELKQRNNISKLDKEEKITERVLFKLFDKIFK